MTTLYASPRAIEARDLPLTGWRLALELTGQCQLTCTHCYAMSGPAGSHGTMTGDDWCRLISHAAALGADRVQFIGGEPTMHPAFEKVLAHVTTTGMALEVFTNLYRVATPWWELFTRSGVSLAFSYYSDDPAEHARITRRPDSYRRTKANVVRAVELGIPVRAAIVEVVEGQRIEQAHDELHILGVTHIRVDYLRGIGRGTTGATEASQLCGRCGDRRLAVSPFGDVTPCVMSRWMITGNVHQCSLSGILAGQAWREVLTRIPAQGRVCAPECNPSQDGNDCAPAEQIDGE
ncbi:Iron-sulfur cluster-binding domain-containing protein [Sinosporangium album]|uniref:Iron-sulfur cluster-binding domain-containing protein n=1 Tax=Sinosporangium album TaxID=504805 RepID=A0A1G8HLX0_9ACTN|nr:radical SAM protein [Sinosporangium album]SDI07678.1 Iron-sulfur cluster-binding domain-containing protein [Sinosporangium album]